mmetsp:Transcript_40778/g.64634  ORF Transcript_40778/g.64634 Transcript_40778/m.64634 type:complete len:110 (-) Transcript_40778:38-367(-)
MSQRKKQVKGLLRSSLTRGAPSLAYIGVGMGIHRRWELAMQGVEVANLTRMNFQTWLLMSVRASLLMNIRWRPSRIICKLMNFSGTADPEGDRPGKVVTILGTNAWCRL